MWTTIPIKKRGGGDLLASTPLQLNSLSQVAQVIAPVAAIALMPEAQSAVVAARPVAP